jgi:protein-tyrosine phosphatase
MVCLGNICRSPLAHGLLRDKSDKNNLNIEVDSAGTSGFHAGEAPDPRMRETAKRFTLNIDDLRARQFVDADFNNFDLIYAMDRSNFDNILSLAASEADKAKVKLILNESNPGSDLEVPDPYYGGDQGFVDVYNMLNLATHKIIEKYSNE